MTKRQKKNEQTKWLCNLVYFHVEQFIVKGHTLIIIPEEIRYDSQWWQVSYRNVKPTIKELRKHGYIVKVKRFVPRELGSPGWFLDIENFNK